MIQIQIRCYGTVCLVRKVVIVVDMLLLVKFVHLLVIGESNGQNTTLVFNDVHIESLENWMFCGANQDKERSSISVSSSLLVFGRRKLCTWDGRNEITDGIANVPRKIPPTLCMKCRKHFCKEEVRKKRRRSKVAVIIVRLTFISSFLFYCLLSNHSFPTNPHSITNLCKLFSLPFKNF